MKVKEIERFNIPNFSIHNKFNTQKIPRGFQNRGFADFIADTPAKKRIKFTAEKYATTFTERIIDGTCLIFLGNPGTGKTLLSLILYHVLTNEGFHIHYEYSLQFLKFFHEKRFESLSYIQAQISKYIQPDLLILDEISESINYNDGPTEFEKIFLFDVINARYEQQRPVFLISNRSIQDLENKLSIPTVNRLLEKGFTLIFDW